MINIKPLEPDVKIEKLPQFVLKVYIVSLKNVFNRIKLMMVIILKMFKSNGSIETDLSKIDLTSIGNNWLDDLYPFQKTGIQLVIKI